MINITNVATDFAYANEKLSDYNMMLCTFESNNGVETILTGHNVTFENINPIGSNRFYYTSTKYSEPLTSQFQICNRFGNTIDTFEKNNILRWLGRNDGVHQFKLYQTGYENVFFNGFFSNIQEIRINGNLCGFELTFTTDSSFAFMDTIEIDIELSSNQSYDIVNFSDEIGILYPKIVAVTCLDSGVLNLCNAFENRVTSVDNCSINEVITFLGEQKIITSSDETHKVSNDFNYNYFRLCNSYDNRINTISASIPCNVHIEYNPIRKVGLK